jgi:GAF domain-containing protein
VEPIPETTAALEELARQGQPEMHDLVLRLGDLARQEVPECVGLSLALLEDGITLTLVSSSMQTASLDALQYVDGGPCVEAAHADRVVDVSIGDLLEEERWALYARASAAAGVRSSLTLPIVRGGTVVGTVNMYAATADAFVGHHEELARALGASAEHAMTNTDLSFRTRMAAVEAPTQIADQYDVDIAIGMLVESRGLSPSEASERITGAAARAGITLGQAARTVRGALLR